MKTYNHLISVTISMLTFSFLLFTGSISAQSNVWRGGTPGSENAWNNARNWSLNHVPDWTDAVVIIPNVESNSGFFPVVDDRVPAIQYLNIEGGAKVYIGREGSLTVNGETTYNHGIQNTGDVYNAGKLVIVNTALSPIALPQDNIHNEGVIAFEDYDDATEGKLARN